MCEQTEINYLDGEVVWVKLGSCWWPGEVLALEKLPPDVLQSFRKPPIACVKFFQEDAFEYVKNINNIYKYNCSRKHEFINKGLYMFRTKHGHMEKFPEDIIRAETAIGGDVEILTRDEFQESKRESYAGIFGDPKKPPSSMKKGKSGRGRPRTESPTYFTPRRQMKEKTDYKVHILVQGSKQAPITETTTSEVTSTPSTSTDAGDKTQDENTPQTEEQQKEDNTENKETLNSSISIPSTPLRSAPSNSVASSSGIYACHACPFTTTRLNVLILHNKTHSVSFVPYTPSPVRKKPVVSKSLPKSTPNSSKTPKPRKPRKEKPEKPPKKLQAKKRMSQEKPSVEAKKPKTDEEIKSSLLADWDDDVDEDSNDESSMIVSAQSPEVPVGAESPAVPTPAELPSAQVPIELSPVPDKKSSSSPSTEKPESSSDSKYEFCEDEDWPEEADFGRKIPRVKNPIRTEDVKSIGIDEDDVAREVAELLNKTAVPELPSVPEPLKIEENFPEPSIVKSPDKNQDKNTEQTIGKSNVEAPPTKAIFKTKTFFRSRHSRSQDAIGKYVAEQLNAVERMDISESEINGSEAVSSPEARDSPPIEPVKVARLAPKIQLKKMKAEAAQLREKEKMCFEHCSQVLTFDQVTTITAPEVTKPPLTSPEAMKVLPILEEIEECNKSDISIHSKPAQDVLYPTQEIKPLNAENPLMFNTEIVEEQFTDQDAFMEEERIEFEKEVVTTSTLQDETIKLDEETSKLDEGASKLEEEMSNFEVETADFEEETKYDESRMQMNVMIEGHDCHSVDVSFTSSEPELVKETSKYDEEVVQTSAVEEETTEFEKDIHKSEDELVQTSKYYEKPADYEQETHEYERETLNFEENTSKYERKTSKEVEETDESHQLHTEDKNKIHQELLLNKKSEEEEIQTTMKYCKLQEPLIEENEEHSTEILNEKPTKNKSQDQMGAYMNESTASAVDALLSVSREADRVPRVVSDDLPDDLFEDDNKDTDNTEATDVDDDFNKKMDTQNTFLEENIVEEHIETQEIHHVESVPEISEPEINLIETSTPEIMQNEEIVDTAMDTSNPVDQEVNNVEVIIENVPSESDLQVAEALINLPSTAIQGKTPTEQKESLIVPFSFDENGQEEIVPAAENQTEIGFIENEVISETVEQPAESIEITDSDNINNRFETEQEKSENLNAAQSLVQMSESIEHKINIVEQMDTKEITDKSALDVFKAKQNNGIDTSLNSVEHNVALLSNDNNSETVKPQITKSTFDHSSSKLLKILEEPCKPKFVNKTTSKPIIMQGKEKILNFDVAKSSFKTKTPKQKIIIRRSATSNKTMLNNVNDLPGSDKIILSRSGNSSQEGSSVQTFTIQTSPDTPSDANTIIIQQKIRKITKPVIQPKLQKIKPQTSLVAPMNEMKTINKTPPTNVDAIFDINSMPIVLSEDLLTPESIEKMPVVMSDGNIIGQSQSATKIMKPKQKVIEHEKVSVSSAPHKQEVKTLLLNQGGDVTKSMTPNILSKSSKLRGAKPMLVIDKATGKQKIIMTKAEPPVKEVKQPPTIIQQVPQAPKPEKFIILPTQSSSPRPARTQKIVIDPQTGKAHVFVAKGSDAPLSATENKPVSAKLVPSNPDASAPGNTVMIITNAHGAQSRIVLTPEHEKILFPNKQQPNMSQLKTITHRLTTTTPAHKTLMTSIAPVKTPTIAPVKAPTRIVPKQKSAIITSKGQLIVGGRVATTAQNIAPMPELRPVSRRIVTSEPKKTQIVQKTNSEPIIFLQQKSGTVMQLTAAQFEHLQRTGQIVQKVPAPVQEKVIIQKVKPANEPGPSIKRVRKHAADSPAPSKKVKHEIAIAPAPAPSTLVPALAPVTVPLPALVSAASNVVSSSVYSEFDNFEEMLPSTAIARQQEPTVIARQQEPTAIARQQESTAIVRQQESTAIVRQQESTAIVRQQEPPPPEPVPIPVADVSAAIADGQLLAVPGEHFGGLVGTFYLCLEDSGNYTAIDNRPLVLENNQLVPMTMEAPQPERRDILEAALANSDVFHADAPRDDAPDFRDLNANVSVHCRVSETSTTLHQPIMTPVEVPSSAGRGDAVLQRGGTLEDGLAVIGVTPHTVPTSLELPITVTDPRIAPKTTDPLSGANFGAPLLPSPGVDLFETSSAAGPISMPLLTDDDAVGKSMPILTDEVAASSLGSGGSPDSEGGWARRLLTPGSDSSEASQEIPLQPSIQLSVGDLDRS